MGQEDTTENCESQQPKRAIQDDMMQPMTGLTFAQRFSIALERAGIHDDKQRRREAARLFGVSTESVRKWLMGESYPEIKHLQQMAEKLDCSVEWLLSGKGDNEQRPPPRTVPLVSYVRAGDWAEAADPHPPGVADEWIEVPTSVKIRRHTFALRVEGDSMEPRFPAGTIIIVEPEMDALPGHFVVARNGEGEATFKQLARDGGEWLLRPLNPHYPIRPLGDSKIVGVAIRAEATLAT